MFKPHMLAIKKKTILKAQKLILQKPQANNLISDGRDITLLNQQSVKGFYFLL